MTLRDLTPRQRDLLCRRAGKEWRVWDKRLARSNVQQNTSDKNVFNIGYNSGVKAVLDILLTPKNVNACQCGKISAVGIAYCPECQP